MRYLSHFRHCVLFLALVCTACGTALPTVKPYKLDIQQGNVVTSKMLLQLRPGMTKSQVRYIMGTPLIQDSFHGNRWDYVYQMREQGKVVEQRRVILDFENELLAKVRGDVTPAAGDKPATETSTVNTGTRTINPSAKPAEKGVLDKLKFWKKDEVKPAEAAPVKATEEVKTEVSQPVATEQAVEDVTKKAVETNISPDERAPAQALPTIPLETAPTEEPKSILAVPLALPATPAPIEKAPVVAPAAKALPKVEAPKVVTPKVESTQAVEKVLPKKEVEMSNAKSEVMTPLEKKAAPENSASENADLPDEDSPSYFDKLLEKIGF